MDGNTVLRNELDRGENRVIERWEYYLPDQLLQKIRFSRGGDEVVDAWAYEDGDGAVDRIEISTLRNGQVDRWEHYEADVLASPISGRRTPGALSSRRRSTKMVMECRTAACSTPRER